MAARRHQGHRQGRAFGGELADKADESQNVYLVPAFVGLGAPHWDAEARGAIFGLTRNSGPAEFARAALESVAFQTRDLLDAMRKDWKANSAETVLRVDGGMVASDWTMQRLADILDAPVDRPTILETTALGAAWLAGSRAGVWPQVEAFAQTWSLERRFEPGDGARHSGGQAQGLARRRAAHALAELEHRTENWNPVFGLFRCSFIVLDRPLCVRMDARRSRQTLGWIEARNPHHAMRVLGVAQNGDTH